MSEKTTKTAALTIAEVHVPKSIKSAINKDATAQKKGAEVMQERMRRMGGNLAVVKDDHCNGETKLFGKWLDANCPKVHENYIAFYIAMYKDAPLCDKVLSAYPDLVSAQTIVRKMRDWDTDPLNDALSKDARKENAKKKAAKKVKKNSTKTASYSVDGKTLSQLLTDAEKIHAKIINYSNAQDFTGKINTRLEAMRDGIDELLS